MKKIAVITPVFNGEKFLVDCLQAVALSIVDKDFMIEHIVVDDCSTDNSWQVIQANKYPHLKSFSLQRNVGSSVARNFAVQQTNAEFIFFLDQDDVIFQNSLRSLLEYSKNQSAEWVYGDFLRTKKDLTYTLGQDYYGHQFESPSDLLTAIFSAEHFFQQNCFYRKQIFDSVGGFDKRIAVYQDLDLFIRFSLAGYLPKYLPAPLYLHRLHENNFSKVSGRENNLEAHKEDIRTLYQKYGQSLKLILTYEQLKKIEGKLSKC